MDREKAVRGREMVGSITLDNKAMSMCVICLWRGHMDSKYAPPLLAFSLSHSSRDRTQVLMFTWQALYQVVFT